MALSRNTRQKLFLEKELLKMTDFFSAEEFFQALPKQKEKISLPTLYRFLKQKVNNRKLHSFSCNKRTVYSTSTNNHAHFTCQACNQKRHMNFDSLDFLKGRVPGTICHVQLDVFGICNDCAKRKR